MPSERAIELAEEILNALEGVVARSGVVNRVAEILDRRVFITKDVLYYPPGETMFRGAMRDNSYIARVLLDENSAVMDEIKSLGDEWRLERV